jgi:hypothetical protein
MSSKEAYLNIQRCPSPSSKNKLKETKVFLNVTGTKGASMSAIANEVGVQLIPKTPYSISQQNRAFNMTTHTL